MLLFMCRRSQDQEQKQMPGETFQIKSKLFSKRSRLSLSG